MLARRIGPRTRSAGFTLVELMVSMVGGIFVSMAVFAIAKHSSSFSMQQSRIADATLQNVVGFERLRADIARAGFLSTPNMVDDPRLCKTSTYPAWLERLASVYIEPVASPSSEMTVNGLTPSRIVLGGSYASANEFIVRRIIEAAQPVVVLQPNSLGMVEMGFAANPTAETLERVFAKGRALRIVDRTGRTQYGKIDTATVGTGGEPTITLAASPALTFRAGAAGGCGIDGFGTQYIANVVNIIGYDLRDLDDELAFPQYVPMFVGGPGYDKHTRRELIREELDLEGNAYPDSLELVAEYAVDLGFSLFVARTQTQPLSRLLPSQVADFAGTPGAVAGQGPQRIRAVQVWLSTRSQEADRTLGLGLTTTAPGPELLRVSLHPTDGTKPPFARVRTVQSMVPLNNQAMVPW